MKGIKYLEDKSAHFMATVGPMLRPIKVHKNEFIFMEQDPVDASEFSL